MKKILASLLAVCMVLSMLVVVPFTASAATTVGYVAPTPTVAKGTYTKLAALEGDPVAGACYEVCDADDMVKFADLVNHAANNAQRFEQVTVYQTANINMSTVDNFVGIGFNAGTYFLGTFDGQGYQIDNLTQTKGATDNRGGLFSLIFFSAVIKNVYLTENCKFICSETTSTMNGFGTIVGQAYHTSKLENCYSAATISSATTTNPSNSGNRAYVGGMIGVCSSTNTFTGLTFAGVVNSGIAGGGIVGMVSSGQAPSFTNCLNSGDVTVNNPLGNDGVYDAAGGIVGHTQSAITVDGCQSTGTVASIGNTTKKAAGSIIGNQQVKDGTVVKNCSVSGVLLGSMTGLVANPLTYTVTATNNTDNTVKHDLATVTHWEGYQVGTGENANDLRLVASIDSINYNSIVFEISVTAGGQTKTLTRSLTNAYSSLLADGDPITAPAYRGTDARLVALVIEDLPAGQELSITVNTYSVLTQGADRVLGESATFTVTLPAAA